MRLQFVPAECANKAKNLTIFVHAWIYNATFCSGTGLVTVFRIRAILVRIRILVSIPLTNGSGFRTVTKNFSDFSDTEKKFSHIFSWKYDPGCSFQIPDPDLVPSRLLRSKKHRFPNPDPQKTENWAERTIKKIPVKGLCSPVNSHPSQHAYFLRQTHLKIKKLRKSNEPTRPYSTVQETSG